MNSEGDSSSIKSVPYSLSIDMNHSLSFAQTCEGTHRTVCNLSAHISMLFTTMSPVNFGFWMPILSYKTAERTECFFSYNEDTIKIETGNTIYNFVP
jgi:hypothetical protein